MRFGTIDSYLLIGCGVGSGVNLLECASSLKASGYSVLVITSPRYVQEIVLDTGRSFGQCLLDHNLEYLVCEEISAESGVIDRITTNTLGLSLGAPWIFRKEFIDRFEGRLLNLHGARLPLDRGGGGFSWQILRENRLGCCLIHQVDPGIDSGPIVKYREFFYPAWCRIPQEYELVYVQENRQFLAEFFEEVKENREFRCIEQQEYFSSYWPRLSTEHHGYVNWSWSLRQIERFICAFDNPYKGVSTFVNGKRVYLKSCFVDFSDGAFHPFQKGIVYRKSSAALFVATEEGTLVIGIVTDEFDARIEKDIRVGDRFYTPVALLEKAQQFRAVFTPMGLKG